MGIQMFQEHSECWKISSVSIWHSTQPGTARKCGLASSAQTEQKWVDGLGEDNPTDFLIRAVCISLCQRQAPCPLQNQTKVFLETSSQTTGQGFFFPGCWRRNSLSTWRSQISFNLTPLKCSFQKASYVPHSNFLQENCGRNHANSSFGWKVYRILFSKCSFVVCAKHSFGSLRPKPCPKALHLPGGSCCEADSKLLPAQVNFEIPHLEAATGQVAPVAWGIGCFACQFSFASNESLEVSWNHRKFDDLAQEVYLYIQYVFLISPRNVLWNHDTKGLSFDHSWTTIKSPVLHSRPEQWPKPWWLWNHGGVYCLKRMIIKKKNKTWFRIKMLINQLFTWGGAPWGCFWKHGATSVALPPQQQVFRVPVPPWAP